MTPAFTIEEFWTQRLITSHAEPIRQTKGWQLVSESAGIFKEAPLDLSDEFTSEFSPLASPMILVSAPGAVGKTTLAKQIAYRTGAIYIDLAQSEPVGGHTLSGGLVRAGVYDRWQAGTTTVLVDGLDEGRLRVTQEAFEAFLDDVLELSVKRTLPTVLFGRSGSIQDAWFILAASGVEVPVLEIGYFGIEDAIEFATAKLRTDYPARLHPEPDKRAIALLLERIPASCKTFLSEQAFAPQNTRFWSRRRVWFQFTVGEDKPPMLSVDNRGKGVLSMDCSAKRSPL